MTNTWPPKVPRCEGCGERAALDGHKRDCTWLAAARDRALKYSSAGASALSAVGGAEVWNDREGWIDPIREAVR